MLHGLAIDLEIRRLGIKVHLSTKVLEINNMGVVGDGLDGQKLFEADAVVFAVGQSPLRDEADVLRFCAPHFHQIGDCLTPKNIGEATRAAFNIAMDIGSY
jgi:NADPH-dependent 2,4-dienoyl-CoA reductase/sulfur reductase-like enzyme